MPAKAAPAASGEVTLSPKEMQVLALSWQCMDSEPKIDMAKLALLTGYTEGSASVTFGKIKRKLKSLVAQPGDSAGATPVATPKAGRKRAAKNDGSGGDDEEVPATPAPKAKKPRTPKAKKGAAIKNEESGSGGDEANNSLQHVKNEKESDDAFGAGEFGGNGTVDPRAFTSTAGADVHFGEWVNEVGV